MKGAGKSCVFCLKNPCFNAEDFNSRRKYKCVNYLGRWQLIWRCFMKLKKVIATALTVITLISCTAIPAVSGIH